MNQLFWPQQPVACKFRRIMIIKYHVLGTVKKVFNFNRVHSLPEVFNAGFKYASRLRWWEADRDPTLLLAVFYGVFYQKEQDLGVHAPVSWQLYFLFVYEPELSQVFKLLVVHINFDLDVLLSDFFDEQVVDKFVDKLHDLNPAFVSHGRSSS